MIALRVSNAHDNSDSAKTAVKIIDKNAGWISFC